MSHCLIIGQTESGKSTLARKLAVEYGSRGIPSLIYDPIGEDAWKHLGETHSDMEGYIAKAKSVQRHALFIDEAAIAYQENGRKMDILATTIRQWGHRSHFICQRFVGISPTMRNQCTFLYAFNISVKDGKDLADDWNEPQLMECHKLRKGEYIALRRLGKPEHRAVFS